MLSPHRTRRAVALAASLLLLTGCFTRDDRARAPDAAPPTDGFAAPNGDAVPAVGSDETLDIATWNIENFPLTVASARLLADLVTSLEIDLIAVQEIADVAAWDELLERLSGYDALLSTHTYTNGSFQKVGFLYRTSIITVSDPVLIGGDNSYKFPRPALAVNVVADNGVAEPLDFVAISLHLKAGRDDDDRARRRAAMATLSNHIDNHISSGGDPDVIVLGDFNEHLISASGLDTFGDFVDRPDDFTIHTRALADSGGYSFVPSQRLIDHAITTASLADETGGGQTVIPPLNGLFAGYEAGVSDHLPVVITLPIF